MFYCVCCPTAKYYTLERNLFRHEREFNANFIEPRKRSRLIYEASPRLCECCSIPITYEQVVEDQNRKFCSHSCSAKFNNTGRIIKSNKNRACVHCRGTLTHRATRYCSVKCHTVQRNKDKIEAWLSGSSTGGYKNKDLSKYIKRYLIEQAEHKCSECGWDKIHPITGNVPLAVDHIDGDSTNHEPTNLKVLCPNCHSLTATFGSLNRGRGREQRRTYRLDMKSKGRQVA
jgi:phage terminase large subunit GpA-like protein